MSASATRVVLRRDQLAARRERCRAVEASYLLPDGDRVVVYASRGRGVVLGVVLTLALWLAPWCEEHVWPVVADALAAGSGTR